MKRFAEYLTERVRTYNFRLKFACDVNDSTMTKLETALEKFGLESISKPTKTAIQQNPMDFQNISNAEIFIIDVTVKYPTTPQVLTALIHQTLGFPESHIMVRSEQATTNIETDQTEIPQERLEKTPLLQTPYEDTKEPPQYGDRFNRDFLQQLKSTFNVKFAEKTNSDAETTNDLPQGNNSPIGTHKTTLPTIKSNAR